MVNNGASHVVWKVDALSTHDCSFLVTTKEVAGGPRKGDLGVKIVDISGNEAGSPKSCGVIWNLQNCIYPEEALELAAVLTKAAHECYRINASLSKGQSSVVANKKRKTKTQSK